MDLSVAMPSIVCPPPPRCEGESICVPEWLLMVSLEVMKPPSERYFLSKGVSPG